MTNTSDIGQEFIEFSSNIFTRSWGMDALSSKLFAILYIEPQELSIEELAKISGYSLASVSNKMRMLEGFHLVQRMKKPKSKKLFYFAEKNIMDMVEKKMDRLLEGEVIPAKKVLPNLIAKYQKKQNGKMPRKDTEKLKIVKKYYEQILDQEKLVVFVKQFIAKSKKTVY